MLFNENFIFFSFFYQSSMLFNRNFAFFKFFINFPCYLVGNLYFSIFFCKFSILFNGMFSFCHFPMLFNGNLRIEKLGGGDVRTDVRTSGNSPLCPTGHQPFGAAAQKVGVRRYSVSE